MKEGEAEKVEGKVGFEEKKEEKKPEMIKKDEVLFKVDNEGKAIPEEVEIEIYDRELDRELIEEGLLLLQLTKKKKSIDKVFQSLMKDQAETNRKKQEEIDNETDPQKKKILIDQFNKEKNTQGLEEVKSRINSEVLDEDINESREIIKELKRKIDETKTKKSAVVIPCTTGESYLVFEQKKTIEGGKTDDWIADLISKRVAEPSFTLEEAKRLKPDYKIALKEAIMEASNYRTKGYRDIMMEKKLEEEKPLTVKKD